MVVMVTYTGNVFNTTKMFFYIWRDGHFYVVYILTQLKKKKERDNKREQGPCFQEEAGVLQHPPPLTMVWALNNGS